MFPKAFASSAAFATLLFMTAQPSEAVNMSLYVPQKGVDRAFGPFLNEFYTQAEATTAAASTAFVSMFSNDALFVLGGNTVFEGKEGAAVFKVAITKGNSFNHFPRTAEVVASSATKKTFRVNGSAKETFPNGTCVSNEYTTQWTILKGANGKPIISPAVDSIVQLDLIQQTPSAGDCNSY